METETPTQAEPQPDRSFVAPVVEQVEAARRSLTRVGNWLHGHWPEGVYAPYVDPVRVSRHMTGLADLLAARTALDALSEPVVVTIRDEPNPADGKCYVYARVDLPGCEVVIQSYRDLWLQAFPADLCARDGGHLRGPLVEHVAQGAALLCPRCGTECVWSGDTVTEVTR